jgi:parallel beta-helix repeat protein
VTDWNYGIELYGANSNTLSNITANSNYYGILIWYNSNSNTLSNITANYNSYYGIYFDSSSSNILSSITANYNSYGIRLYSSNYTIKNSIIQGNSQYGIYLSWAGANLIYNNLFNNTNNLYFYGIYPNYWNTTRQAGTRVYSFGNEIGGNYWTNPDGNGYSDTCTDADKDGFCDDPYVLATDNVDYLALSDEYPPPPTTTTTTTTTTLPPTTTTLPRLSESSPISALIVVVVLCVAPALWFMREFLTSTELSPVEKLIRVILVMLALIASMILLAQFFSII